MRWWTDWEKYGTSSFGLGQMDYGKTAFIQCISTSVACGRVYCEVVVNSCREIRRKQGPKVWQTVGAVFALRIGLWFEIQHGQNTKLVYYETRQFRGSRSGGKTEKRHTLGGTGNASAQFALLGSSPLGVCRSPFLSVLTLLTPGMPCGGLRLSVGTPLVVLLVLLVSISA
jgi:hypothetical protein